MLEKEHPGLSLVRQCNLLGVSRSSFYYKPKPMRSEDLVLMRLIDDQYMKTPVYGSRSMRDYLNRQGYPVNRKRVQRLMRLMGIEAIYPKPKTSTPHPGHRIYPWGVGSNLDLIHNFFISLPQLTTFFKLASNIADSFADI